MTLLVVPKSIPIAYVAICGSFRSSGNDSDRHVDSAYHMRSFLLRSRLRQPTVTSPAVPREVTPVESPLTTEQPGSGLRVMAHGSRQRLPFILLCAQGDITSNAYCTSTSAGAMTRAASSWPLHAGSSHCMACQP